MLQFLGSSGQQTQQDGALSVGSASPRGESHNVEMTTPPRGASSRGTSSTRQPSLATRTQSLDRAGRAASGTQECPHEGRELLPSGHPTDDDDDSESELAESASYLSPYFVETSTDDDEDDNTKSSGDDAASSEGLLSSPEAGFAGEGTIRSVRFAALHEIASPPPRKQLSRSRQSHSLRSRSSSSASNSDIVQKAQLSDVELMLAFAALDVNGNGVVDHEDIVATLALHGRSVLQLEGEDESLRGSSISHHQSWGKEHSATKSRTSISMPRCHSASPAAATIRSTGDPSPFDVQGDQRLLTARARRQQLLGMVSRESSAAAEFSRRLFHLTNSLRAAKPQPKGIQRHESEAVALSTRFLAPAAFIALYEEVTHLLGYSNAPGDGSMPTRAVLDLGFLHQVRHLIHASAAEAVSRGAGRAVSPSTHEEGTRVDSMSVASCTPSKRGGVSPGSTAMSVSLSRSAPVNKGTTPGSVKRALLRRTSFFQRQQPMSFEEECSPEYRTPQRIANRDQSPDADVPMDVTVAPEAIVVKGMTPKTPAQQVGASSFELRDRRTEGNKLGQQSPRRHGPNPAKLRPGWGVESAVTSMVWSLAAWQERRSLFDIPVLQRLGESFLEYKAGQQERQMKQFLRLYRHLFLRQLNTSATQPRQPNGGIAGITSISGRNHQTGNGGRKRDKSVASNILPFLMPSGPGGGAGDDGAHEAEAFEGFALRSLLQPDPLSMLPSLSIAEREKLSRFRRNAAIRACLIGLLVAFLLGLTELLAAHFILGSTDQSAVSGSSAAYASFITSLVAGLPIFPGSSDDGAPSPISNATAPTTTTVNSTLMLGNASMANASSVHLLENELSEATGLSTLWQYRIAVAIATILLSFFEIVLLYADNLRVAFAMAKVAGIPLHHHSNRRSEFFLRQRGNEVVTIKESLTRKRVRFVIGALSRCALELPPAAVSVLGVDAAHRNNSWFVQAIHAIALRLRKSVAVVLIRTLVARIVSKVALPFAGTPLLVLWNYLVSSGAMGRSQRVVVGAVAAEKLMLALLRRFFSAPAGLLGVQPPRWPKKGVMSSGWSNDGSRSPRSGSRSASMAYSTASTADGAGEPLDGVPGPAKPLAVKFAYVPYHVYREAICVIAYASHIRGVVHPCVHLQLSALAAHVVTPDTAVDLPDDQSLSGNDASGLGVADTSLGRYVRQFCNHVNALEANVGSMPRQELLERAAPVVAAELGTALPTSAGCCGCIPSRGSPSSSELEAMLVIDAAFPAWSAASATASKKGFAYFNADHVRFFMLLVCVSIATMGRHDEGSHLLVLRLMHRRWQAWQKPTVPAEKREAEATSFLVRYQAIADHYLQGRSVSIDTFERVL